MALCLLSEQFKPLLGGDWVLHGIAQAHIVDDSIVLCVFWSRW
jgi:hypothetical protein